MFNVQRKNQVLMIYQENQNITQCIIKNILEEENEKKCFKLLKKQLQKIEKILKK